MIMKDHEGNAVQCHTIYGKGMEGVRISWGDIKMLLKW